MRKLFFFIAQTIWCTLSAQFPGPVGTPGTTALYKDSSAFVNWGTQCHVVKALQDISTPSLGLVTIGDSSSALGKADLNVVSLGDGGYAIVTFTTPIINGSGYDFAVFENSFNDTFLELGFVEVSSDGINFFRFPATSNSPISPQYGNAAVMDATLLDNLAGKYRGLYGTPYDLQQLSGIPLLNINMITHVKIIDVVGSINSTYARYDKNNNIINDPWPTPYPSSGFDLDAVGVINQAAVGIEEFKSEISFNVYPNPFSSELMVRSSEFYCDRTVLKIRDILGKEVRSYKLESYDSQFDLSELTNGMYFVSIENTKGKASYRLIKE